MSCRFVTGDDSDADGELVEMREDGNAEFGPGLCTSDNFNGLGGRLWYCKPNGTGGGGIEEDGSWIASEW